MRRSLEDFIDRTARAKTLQEVGAQLKSSLSDEGFDSFGFLHFRHGVPTGSTWDEFPRRFLAVYREQRWDRVDPHVRVAMRRHGAFEWRAAQPPVKLSSAQLDFYSELKARGMNSGAIVPLRGPNGEFTMCGTNSSSHEPLTPAKLGRVGAIAMQAWLRHADLTQKVSEPATRLSRREIECLTWLKDGKTNWEIGEILDISEKTVEFHVGNAMRKLKVDNRVAAVVAALRNGVIDL